MTPEELRTLVEEMCAEIANGRFVPILEADVSAFLYHLMIARETCSPANIHVDTRITGSDSANDRFDLVIGSVQRRLHDGRPAAVPNMIIEIKAFPIGFTHQQYRIRLEHILNDDLRKLGYSKISDASRVLLIFDAVGYLRGSYHAENRLDVILDRREQLAAGAKVLVAQKTGNVWEVLLK